MKKLYHSKALTFIVLIALVFTLNTGIAFADTSITYPNSQNLIEKVSHPTTGEKVADGILPEIGDRSNSYTWTLSQLGDYVYIGSNRNVLAATFLQATSSYLDPALTLKFLGDISDGDIPTNPSDVVDNTARMFRYNLKTKVLEEVYKKQGISGYRGTSTFQSVAADHASVYFGSLGANAQVLRFGSDFKVGDSPEVVYEAGDPGYSSIRAMATHQDSMCIGVLTVAGDEVTGNVQIMQATNPAINSWTEIASMDDFSACSPRTDQSAPAQSGVWDMISYNGSIYAFIGSGYQDGSENNGYAVFKGTYLPENEDANDAGWVWKMIVGPLEDSEGNPTGAIYPRGLGNSYDGSASPFLYTDPNGKTYVYVGTFDSIFDSIFEILSTKSYESLYRAMHPAKIYRFDENDNWEMIIGNPDTYFNEKKGNYYAGFSNTTQASVYSPNLYLWRMAQYDGELYAGTLDASTLMDIIVPPLKIDFDSYNNKDLLKILGMAGSYLPDEVVEELTDAIMAVDTASQSAIEAQAIYEESVVVAASGDLALAAADAACSEAAIYTPAGIIVTPCALYSALLDSDTKTANFADLASAAAVKYSLATTTAALSDTAAGSASAARTAWEQNAEFANPFEPADAGLISQARTNISAAVDAAHLYQIEAQNEATAAAEEYAEEAAKAAQARANLIMVSNKINKLLGSINAEQYAQMSDLFGTLADLGYGTGEYQELRYILEMRVMINTNKEADEMGCSVYRTSDGLNFTAVTTNGFNDKYNYGLRTFLPTTDGLFMGMANPFYGAQLWKLGDLPTPPSTGGGGGGSSSSTVIVAVTKSAILGPLNMTDHFAYILGYEDGTIKPLANMTRAEVATIFYRLLTNESRAKYQTETSTFSDVTSKDWFNTAVSTLAKAKILSGYQDGTFLPNAIMSRAEFATIITRLAELQGGSSNFTDISAHWAKNYINTAFTNSWVSGYADNTFRPDQPITRAEVMTIVNRALHRVVKASNMLDAMTKWSDSASSAWYYEAVQEATNSHNYKLTTELVPGQTYYYEQWTELTKNPDWNTLK